MNEHNVAIAVVCMRNESIARKLRLGAMVFAIGCGIGTSGCASTSDGNYLSGANGHGKCVTPNDDTCHARSPHLDSLLRSPLPQAGRAKRGGRSQANESLREFHVNQPISAASARSEVSPRSKALAHAAEEKLGIQLAGLRLSAAGYMLDFRYKVIDPDKAAPLLNRKIRPYLLDDASGAQLGVPDTAKLGQLRTTGRNKVVAEQDYFILFANPGRFVQAGNKMTLVMGDLRIENLSVE